MLPPAAATHDSSKITAVTAAADIEQANPECPYQDEAYFDVIMRVRRHPAGPDASTFLTIKLGRLRWPLPALLRPRASAGVVWSDSEQQSRMTLTRARRLTLCGSWPPAACHCETPGQE